MWDEIGYFIHKADLSRAVISDMSGQIKKLEEQLEVYKANQMSKFINDWPDLKTIGDGIKMLTLLQNFNKDE